MIFRRKKIGSEKYVWGVQAARILGISRSVFNQRFRDNKYPDIGGRNLRKGNQYILRDVVEMANPRKSRKEIDELVYKHIEEIAGLRKRYHKKGGKKK